MTQEEIKVVKDLTDSINRLSDNITDFHNRSIQPGTDLLLEAMSTLSNAMPTTTLGKLTQNVNVLSGEIKKLSEKLKNIERS